MDAGTISYAWYEAGKWDSAHGLMPMAVGSIPDEARESYARGYHQGQLGQKTNAYRDAYRPDSDFYIRVR